MNVDDIEEYTNWISQEIARLKIEDGYTRKEAIEILKIAATLRLGDINKR